MLDFTLLGIGVSARSDVRRNTSWDQVNNMIMILSKWKNFWNIFECLVMIINGPLEIYRYRRLR